MTRMSQLVSKRLAEIPTMPDETRPHPHTSVGIEVEVEGMGSMGASASVFNNLKCWNVVSDGSLQNGIEFVSEPVWGTAITDALEELKGVFISHPPHISFRTSIHVHINILDMSDSQLIHMVKTYLVYEQPLFRLHEEWGRVENIFCVPAFKSLDIQKGYSSLIRGIGRGSVSTSYIPSKYSAMNPNSIGSLGTLEFRHMGGTADTDAISEWINVLLQLKVAGLNGSDTSNPHAVWGDQLPLLNITETDVACGLETVDNLNLWR